MAYVDVPGSNNIWEYDNTATASNTYSDSAAGANSVIANGIRTYTAPGTGRVTKVYIRCTKKGTTVARGELSTTYYDEQ